MMKDKIALEPMVVQHYVDNPKLFLENVIHKSNYSFSSLEQYIETFTRTQVRALFTNAKNQGISLHVELLKKFPDWDKGELKTYNGAEATRLKNYQQLLARLYQKSNLTIAPEELTSALLMKSTSCDMSLCYLFHAGMTELVHELLLRLDHKDWGTLLDKVGHTNVYPDTLARLINTLRELSNQEVRRRYSKLSSLFPGMPSPSIYNCQKLISGDRRTTLFKDNYIVASKTQNLSPMLIPSVDAKSRFFVSFVSHDDTFCHEESFDLTRFPILPRIEQAIVFASSSPDQRKALLKSIAEKDKFPEVKFIEGLFARDFPYALKKEFSFLESVNLNEAINNGWEEVHERFSSLITKEHFEAVKYLLRPLTIENKAKVLNGLSPLAWETLVEFKTDAKPLLTELVKALTGSQDNDAVILLYTKLQDWNVDDNTVFAFANAHIETLGSDESVRQPWETNISTWERKFTSDEEHFTQYPKLGTEMLKFLSKDPSFIVNQAMNSFYLNFDELTAEFCNYYSSNPTVYWKNFTKLFLPLLKIASKMDNNQISKLIFRENGTGLSYQYLSLFLYIIYGENMPRISEEVTSNKEYTLFKATQFRGNARVARSTSSLVMDLSYQGYKKKHSYAQKSLDFTHIESWVIREQLTFFIEKCLELQEQFELPENSHGEDFFIAYTHFASTKALIKLCSKLTDATRAMLIKLIEETPPYTDVARVLSRWKTEPELAALFNPVKPQPPVDESSSSHANQYLPTAAKAPPHEVSYPDLNQAPSVHALAVPTAPPDFDEEPLLVVNNVESRAEYEDDSSTGALELVETGTQTDPVSQDAEKQELEKELVRMKRDFGGKAVTGTAAQIQALNVQMQEMLRIQHTIAQQLQPAKERSAQSTSTQTDQVPQAMERLTEENTALKAENESLKTQLSAMKQKQVSRNLLLFNRNLSQGPARVEQNETGRKRSNSFTY